MKISSPLSRWLNALLMTLAFAGLAQATWAQKLPSPEQTTYAVKPDYRKCAYPVCGGWYLTPLNQYSLQLTSEDEALQNASILPNSIYVAELNLKALGLDTKQTAELKAALYGEQALLRGNLVTSINPRRTLKITRLDTSAAWISANKNPPVGSYLNVTSSGIVCITTPCPYYTAEIINSQASSNFDELNFAKAELDREQEAQAWQAVATGGLVMTGVKYEAKGQTGTGLGIAATKVYFAFPPKR